MLALVGNMLMLLLMIVGLAQGLALRLDGCLVEHLATGTVTGAVTGSTTGVGATGAGTTVCGNFRLDLGYVGGVDRELIARRNLDVDLDCF